MILLELPLPGKGCSFFVPCNPPTANHQRKKIVRAGKFLRLADKPELVAAREFWTGLLAAHRPQEPFRGAIALSLIFVYPWPKSATKRARSKGFAYKVTKPDCTNAAKTVEDILVALRFFGDDAQVARLVVEKRLGDECGLGVVIQEIEPEEVGQ